MTQEPAVASVRVTGTYAYEGVTIEAEAAPGGALDFGEVDGSLPYTFEVTGYDGAGNPVMRGTSIGGIVLDAIEGDTFQIFAQRLGQWARPPGQLSRAHTRAPAISVGERYLLTTGGDARQDAERIEQYDLFAWAGIDAGEAFDFSARSLWWDPDTLEVLALGSDTTGEAASFNGAEVLPEPIQLPDGLSSFGEIAGGSVVQVGDGREFIVGATRATTPTDAVIDVGADGTRTVRRLVQKRAGAAVTWVPGVGLVVAGGSAEGPGVEVLAEQATTFATHDFPPDATIGAGASPSSYPKQAMLIGGTTDGTGAKTRTLDLGCTIDCAPKAQDLATPEAALTRVSAYPVGQGRLIVVGDEADPSGLTRTFVVDYIEETVTELPLREPRRWATPVPTPNGKLAILGGVHPDGTPALTVEMLVPE